LVGSDIGAVLTTDDLNKLLYVAFWRICLLGLISPELLAIEKNNGAESHRESLAPIAFVSEQLVLKP
jgi:hypothetical protein